jgi:hypothetical protein
MATLIQQYLIDQRDRTDTHLRFTESKNFGFLLSLSFGQMKLKMEAEEFFFTGKVLTGINGVTYYKTTILTFRHHASSI